MKRIPRIVKIVFMPIVLLLFVLGWLLSLIGNNYVFLLAFSLWISHSFLPSIKMRPITRESLMQ